MVNIACNLTLFLNHFCLNTHGEEVSDLWYLCVSLTLMVLHLTLRQNAIMGRHHGMHSHVSGMRCVLARNHESERDALILLSPSLSFAQKRNAFWIHGTAPLSLGRRHMAAECVAFLRKTMRVRDMH